MVTTETIKEALRARLQEASRGESPAMAEALLNNRSHLDPALARVAEAMQFTEGGNALKTAKDMAADKAVELVSEAIRVLLKDSRRSGQGLLER